MATEIEVTATRTDIDADETYVCTDYLLIHSVPDGQPRCATEKRAGKLHVCECGRVMWDERTVRGNAAVACGSPQRTRRYDRMTTPDVATWKPTRTAPSSLTAGYALKLPPITLTVGRIGVAGGWQYTIELLTTDLGPIHIGSSEARDPKDRPLTRGHAQTLAESHLRKLATSIWAAECAPRAVTYAGDEGDDADEED